MGYLFYDIHLCVHRNSEEESVNKLTMATQKYWLQCSFILYADVSLKNTVNWRKSNQKIRIIKKSLMYNSLSSTCVSLA